MNKQKTLFAALAIIVLSVGFGFYYGNATVSGVIHNGNGGPGYDGNIYLRFTLGSQDTVFNYLNLPAGANTITQPNAAISMTVGGEVVYPGSASGSFSESGYTWSIWMSSDGLEHYIERL